MPNWCANQIRISGSVTNIREVMALINGEIYPLYREAILKSIKLFVSGEAGVLRPLYERPCPLYPDLLRHGVGDAIDANLAFSEWLEFFCQDVELTEENSRRIVDLYTRTGLSALKWEHLSSEKQEMIQALFSKKYHDWSNVDLFDSITVDQWWQHLDNPPQPVAFDMRQLVPTRLAAEINGFNGGLLNTCSTYDLYIAIYGIKWPVAYDFDLNSHQENADTAQLEISFDTPWAPPSQSVFLSLSEKYSCSIEHFYSEAGMCFCGVDVYESGEQVSSQSGELEYGPEDEDGISEVIGPDFILDNVRHYGG